MKLDFFFQGKLAREEAASAFLATLLDQRKDVRDAFIETLVHCVGWDVTESLKLRSWQVSTEVDQVDIRLESKGGGDDWVIIVENKLQSGSVQHRQLSGYYESVVLKEKGARIIAVYLSPNSVGKGDVVALKDELREGDYALQLPWDKLSERIRELTANDPDTEFTASGLDWITKTILEGRQIAYPNEGNREQIFQIALRLQKSLASTGIAISAPWPDKDYFLLGTQGTDLTLWLSLRFEVEPEPPYLPKDIFIGDKLRLFVRSALKLSKQGSRHINLKSRWVEAISRETLAVPGVGIHKREGRWFVLEQSVFASVDDVVTGVEQIGVSLLNVVKEWAFEKPE